MSTFNLMKTKRFLPFFVVQFLGAMNDNVYKTPTWLLPADILQEHVVDPADL